MLGLPILLMFLMWLFARHEAELSYVKIFFATAPISLLAIITCHSHPVFAFIAYLVLLPFVLTKFLYVSFLKSCLITISAIAISLLVDISFRHLTHPSNSQKTAKTPISAPTQSPIAEPTKLQNQPQERAIALGQLFDRKLAAGLVQIPLTTRIEIPNQYGKIILSPGTRITVLAMEGDLLKIRVGTDTVMIPSKYADTSSLK